MDLLDMLEDTPPTLPPVVEDGLDNGDYLPLDLYAERAYLEYAMSVVKGRALPQVEDGQKPVQRRILYAMKEMGLTHNAKYVKSARVVGEILGKYHPHGDSSAYEAMVRLAQDFTLRYPLVDGQGNFGSRDGDSAAAMRYTEARLTKLSELLLSEIDMGTVDFQPNYDGAFDEPTLLPARLPMLLLNGASGIAVGMATEIPPHNLTEVAQAAIALIRQPDLSISDLLGYVQGPDFPGGGQIISSRTEIENAYTSGRGSVRVRAKWEVEHLARGQWRVIVTELPPGASAAKVLAEIEEATNPKIKVGKKALSQEQLNIKQLMLSALDKVRDDSDQKQPVRLLFEPKSSRQNPDEFMALLLAQTSMEANTSLNLVMIGLDGRPQQKNLKQILQEWIDFRFATVTRRTEHRLSQVERRIHILEGRMIVFLHIDEVIKVIRESDEPKVDLMAAFGLSEVQAEDILEIRLRQLARLEGFKLEKELAELKDEQAGLQHILANPLAKRDLIIEEIEKDTAVFGDARRTQLQEASRAVLTQTAANEPVTVIVSHNGWLRARVGHGVDLSNLSFKEGDGALAILETRTIHPLILLDSNGRCYTLNVADIPTGRGDGVPASSLIDVQDKARLVQALSAPAEVRYLLVHTGGYGFIASVKDMMSRIKAGKVIVALEKDEQLLPPRLINDAEASLQLALLTDQQRLLCYPLFEVRALSKGRGLMLISLQKDETLQDAVLFAQGLVLVGDGRGGKESSITLSATQQAEYAGPRGRRGKPVTTSWKKLRLGV